ncbi:MAG: hypothetical protein ACHQQ3_01605 [Gemmatimonadales bacterium]
MMWAIRMVLLAGAFAAATIAFGWWGVAIVAACWGVIASARRASALESGLAALLAWGALLGADAARGPIESLAAIMGSVLQVRPVGVYAVTLGFPALLALTSAIVARSLALTRR